ncbi:hypothetical protein NIES4071_37590 [Calothrix sp. NIES-4071]|nr:hypothetical protein NIES4071_37590 [Calothrix sp. NIES-4071]BAZ58076.1 hypothetical protein NIES4105_37520 [Calothrix sp. NIES-4105]
MSGAFYCLDNDIILKIATFDVFYDTLITLGTDASQVKILDTFKYKFQKQIQRTRGNRATSNSRYNVQKALEITQSIATISESDAEKFDTSIYTRLLNYSQNNNDNNTIDKGEAVLISHVCYLNQQGNTNYLLTGDKRCLKALTNSGFTDVIESLNGKVWCLEQLILKNIEEIGFDIIQAKIYPVRTCDSNIKFIFGYSEAASQEIVIEGLRNQKF